MLSVRCGEQPGLSLSEELSAVKSHQHGPSLRTPWDSLQCRRARHTWKERKQIKAVGQWRGLGTPGAQTREHGGLVPVFKYPRGTESPALAQKVH